MCLTLLVPKCQQSNVYYLPAILFIAGYHQSTVLCSSSWMGSYIVDWFVALMGGESGDLCP